MLARRDLADERRVIVNQKHKLEHAEGEANRSYRLYATAMEFLYANGMGEQHAKFAVERHYLAELEKLL